MTRNQTGVLLLNMGGPDKLDDIPAFLYNLFSDRDIIKLGPSFMQKVLARIISHRRAPKSAAIYSKIGGRSPLLEITENQAAVLQDQLSHEGDFVVGVAMRYWQPRVQHALDRLISRGAKEIIALPLYPQYTRATSGSSLKDLQIALKERGDAIPLKIIESWPEEPKYIEALAQHITNGAALFRGEQYQLVYSAHSLPVSFIKDGDPYVDEIHRTINAVEQITGIHGRLCYQSRSGPVEWLSPSTSETIKTLAATGCKNILMVPISFVSDHVETLYEINIQFKAEANALGVRLESTRGLNTNPLFIAALKDLVLKAVTS